MKYISIIVLFLLIAGYFLFYVLSLKSGVEVSYKIKNINLSGISRNVLGIGLDVYTSNKSSSRIDINNVSFDLYYLGKMIATTPVKTNVLHISPNQLSNLAIRGLYIEVKITPETTALLTKYIEKQPLLLNVKLKADLLGLPIRINTNFTYNSY